MKVPLSYKLTNMCQNARTPSWLLQLLRDDNGELHDPCPSSPDADGLQALWSSTAVNFVNPPFSNADQWLKKAREEAHNDRWSIVQYI